MEIANARRLQKLAWSSAKRGGSAPPHLHFVNVTSSMIQLAAHQLRENCDLESAIPQPQENVNASKGAHSISPENCLGDFPKMLHLVAEQV